MKYFHKKLEIVHLISIHLIKVKLVNKILICISKHKILYYRLEY